jgi:lipoyl synthase
MPANQSPSERKPPWLKVRAPGGDAYARIKQTLRGLELHTVCEAARCPNVGECWSTGTATVMILGEVCTRGCRFCAVTSGNPRGVVDVLEPEHVAQAIAQLGLRYVVLTMVDRDDLSDGGASHVAQTVEALHRAVPGLLVETLVGDFGGHRGDVATVLASKPEVFAHNIEVVRRLTPVVRDRRCSYQRSLDVLAAAKAEGTSRFVKSSLMVGLGETDEEVFETLSDLHRAGVDVVTLGQYLRPTAKHTAVRRYCSPEEFQRWRDAGQQIGLAFVASGPLVRSSYHAAEAFVAAGIGSRDAAGSGENAAAGRGQALPLRSDASSNAVPGIIDVSRLTEPRAARSSGDGDNDTKVD